MQIKTFSFKKNIGWSIPNFPCLDSPNTLVLAFAASDYFNHPEPFMELKRAYPNSLFAGCSTAGEILQDEVNDESISTAVIKLDKSRIKVATESLHKNTDSFEVGKNLAEALNDKKLKSVIVLSDGLAVNGSTLVEGLKKNLASSTIITGGLAGDGKNFKQTWVLHNNKPETKLVTAVGLYGDELEIGYGSQGGWDLFGIERRITKSKGNILFEIDGQPALALYKKYLGDRASGLPSTGLLFPLAIKEKHSAKHNVVRTILAINEEDQSMTFAGDIPEGWYAQLMKANFERLVEGAYAAGKLASRVLTPTQESLAIAISCVGRRIVLGEKTEEEIDATLDTLGKNSHLVGFYSYGEISPSGLGSCDLHNQTMTLTTLYEK